MIGGVPLSMVCWCLAVHISLLMPSITWLFESNSFSLGFLLRKITGGGGEEWRVHVNREIPDFGHYLPHFSYQYYG